MGVCRPKKGGISVDLIFNETTQMWEEKKAPFAVIEVETEENFNRLRELWEADLDGRCVVLPDADYTEKDGENALKSAMNTCFYHNNPVTRYIADAAAEKLTSKYDALKGEQNAIHRQRRNSSFTCAGLRICYG